MRVGIVAAFPAEGQCLSGTRLRPQTSLELDSGARLQLAGLGSLNAAEAAKSLLAAGAERLISWGTAAGIDPQLYPGQICLPTRVLTETGASFETDTSWRLSLQDVLSPLQPVSGFLYQSNQIVATAQEKSRIRKQCGAVALDMESGAVAEVAENAGLPFLAIRAIADDAATTLPDAAQHAMDASGRVQIDTVLRRILKSPGDIGRLWTISKGFRIAMRALRQAALLAGTHMSAPTIQTKERIA